MDVKGPKAGGRMRYLIYVMEDGRKWYVAAEVTVLGKLSVALVMPSEVRRARRICSFENAVRIRDRMREWGYDAGVEGDEGG